MRARSHTPDGELYIALRSNASSAAGKLDNVKVVRRVIVSVVGATVLLLGIALLVLPGPAFLVIPVGLAILATEYAWARRWLTKLHRVATEVFSGRERSAIRDLVSSDDRGEHEKRAAGYAEEHANNPK
jgi:uncharacterized protein (TIGR02611 family)